MATSLCKFYIFVAFICLALLFSHKHIVRGDDDLCGTPSALFHGSCLDDEACNNLCKGAEGAIEGFCLDLMCFCINKCQKQELGGTPGSKLNGSCIDDEACHPQNLCQRPSGRFHGLCFDTVACDKLCNCGEGTAGGICQDFVCICVFIC